MSIGLRTREELQRAARYSPVAPRTLDDAGIPRQPVDDNPSLAAAALMIIVLVLSVTAILWWLLVLLFSVDELPDVTEHAQRHWNAYQTIRGER